MVRNYLSNKTVKQYIMSIDQNELHAFEKYVKDNISEQAYLDLVEGWIKGIYDGYNSLNPPPDMKEMKLLTKLHKKWKNGSDAIWITIAPDKLNNPLEFNSRNMDHVSEFCMKWFDMKRYSYYNYVIELGGNIDEPFIHVHAVVQLRHKNMSKNHARDLKKYWERKTFHTLKGKDYYSKNISGIYLNDKLEYMTDNSAKGSHENFITNPYDDKRLEKCRTDTYKGQKGELL